jgi:XTP/dITP diphosphohydrolase
LAETVRQPEPVPVPESAPETEELLRVIAALREHCPWMGALTHESLVEYLLEEAFEVA